MTSKGFFFFCLFIINFSLYLTLNVNINFSYLLVSSFFFSIIFCLDFKRTKKDKEKIKDNFEINKEEIADEHPIIVSAKQRLGKN